MEISESSTQPLWRTIVPSLIKFRQKPKKNYKTHQPVFKRSLRMRRGKFEG